MEPEPERPSTPSELSVPCFLMNFPLSLDNRIPNNVWMVEGERYNYALAFQQFLGLYKYLAQHSLIYLLPSCPAFQDQVFVANLGCYLPHLYNTILISNYQSPPRQGEEQIGKRFFHEMGYDVNRPPNTWEGEADLKYIRDNKYVGGYGIRTDIKSYEWMVENFGMEVVTVRMTDEKLYHFDCSFFPIDEYRALVATAAFSKKDLKKIESIVDVIDVPKRYMYYGWTNALRLGNQILHAPPSGDDTQDAFRALINKIGYEPVLFDLQEYEKSGADLSCMILHLNYHNRAVVANSHQDKYLELDGAMAAGK